LTLNTSQIPAGEDYYPYDEKQAKFLYCDQYAGGGACSLPDSYVNLFYERFWKDSYQEWLATRQAALEAGTFDEFAAAFYDKHNDWFVTSYAATDLEEDIAESFTYFALHPKPSGNSMYEQKVSFFYGFPELVEYRQQIIEGLCSYIR
jgi:hypothetical protein